MASQARQLADKSIAPPGRRNLIINGAMVIDQRNSGSAVTGSASVAKWPTDRFQFYSNTTAAITGQQVSDAPDNFEKSYKITCTTAASGDGANNRLQVVYPIEGYDAAHLQLGSSNAKTITLSFWVKASNTGTYGGSFTNGAANRAYPYSYTISSADTWEYKTVTIAGDTSGTWATDNTSGMYVFWGLGVGSNFEGTANQWNGAFDIAPPSSFSLKDNLNATWQITGVQLEVGSVATEFEHRSFGEELALCQRYYQKSYAYGTAPGSVTTAGWIGSTLRLSDQQTGFVEGDPRFEQRMRTSPTITFYDRNGTVNRVNYYIGGSSVANYTMTVTNNIDTGFSFYTDNTTTKGGVRFAYTADAEL